MASLQEVIQKHIAEAANAPDKNQAAKEIASKLRSLKYSGQDENIPKADLLSTLRVVKGSANDSHLEVLDAVIAALEQGSTE